MDVSLDNLRAGAVMEKFDDELKKVIENIMDPNTEAGKSRAINITVNIKPRKDEREVCAMDIVVKSKLAPTRSLQSQLAVGVNQYGEIAAKEYVPKQGELFESEPLLKKVVNIKG